MLWAFKFVVLALLLFFLNDFYLDSISDDRFLKIVTEGAGQGRKFLDFVEFNYRYPADFISFFIFYIIPATYFAFIRGVGFYEKAIVINRGLPFFNTRITYEDVARYKLIHPKLAISVHTHKGDAFVIADERIERAIAILDQHHIQGDLAQDEFVRVLSNYKKFIVFVATFVVLLFVVRKLGLYFINS